MKKWNKKKWLMILSFAGPAVAHVSCSSAVLQDVRTATIGAFTAVLSDATINILEGALGVGDMP